MKILFVTPQQPHVYGGGAARMWFQIKYLNQLGVQIDLVSFYDESIIFDDTEIRNYVNNIIFVKPKKPTLWSKIKKCVLFKAYDIDLNMLFTLKKILFSKKYDLIHVHKFQLAWYFVNIKNIPVVIDLWACGLKGAYAEVVNEPNFFNKVIKLSRLPRYFLSDLKYYKIFNYYFVVSEEAKQWIKKRYPEKLVFVIPNGVEIKEVSYQEKKDTFNLLFVGDMSFFQNVDTVLFFMKRIFPFIKKEIKNVKFYIVGRNPDKKILKFLKDNSVVITGFVKDISKYYKIADVFVAPIRTGAGIRNKILEAMSYSLPVVTTKYATEGIKVADDVNIMIANNDKEFAKKVINLFNNPDKRKQMGYNAKQLIQTEYNWYKIAQDMVTAYGKILNSYNLK